LLAQNLESRKKIRKVLVAKNYIKALSEFWSLFTDTTNLGGKISIFKKQPACVMPLKMER